MRIEFGNRVGDGVVAGGDDGLDRVAAAEGEGDHDLVSRHRLVVEDALGDPAELVAGLHLVAGLGGRMEVPLPVAGETGQVHAALEEEGGVLRDLAGFGGEFGERILESVVDLREHAGSELGREEVAGEFDVRPDREIRRRFEDLHVALLAADADDLRHELLLAELRVSDFVLGDRTVELDGDHVAVDACDLACCHGQSFRVSGF